jgi:carbonic anhydrase
MSGLKKVLIFIGIVAVVYFVFYLAQNFWLPEGKVTNPGKAEELLQQGNGRYVAGNPLHPNQGLERRAMTTARGQHPFATVLTCSDSRVPVEVLFDCGVGDVFVVRVAGNVVNTDEAGSIEYGVDHLETPLLVVLGHTHCGAVTAVAGGGEIHGNIGALVKNIGTAVKAAKEAHPELSGSALVEEAVVANVWQSVDDLFRTSETARKRVKGAKLKVVGALYDIESGKVVWLGSHPKQFELIKKYEGVNLREDKREGESHS